MNESKWWADLTGEDITTNAYGWPHYRVPPVADFIQPTIRYGPVLDIGCGPGRLGHALAIQNPNVQFVGIDVGKQMVDLANRNSPRNWKAVLGDGVTLPVHYPYGSAYSVTVFQHISHEQVQFYVNQIHDLLLDGGHFIFTYAVGEEDTFLSHQTTHETALSWLADAGFGNYELLDTPDTHPAWNWARGTK